jgi:hypothetical protein
VEVTLIANRSGSWVEANDGLLVMSPFVVQFTGAELLCDVELTGEIRDGLAICISLVLTSTGEPITDLRGLSLPTLLRLASVLATREDDEDRANRAAGVDVWAPAKQDRTARSLRGRKHRITTGLLTEVARIYSDADGWPTKAVADHFGTARSTAATWVGLARKAGLLPEAKNKGPNTARKGDES